MTFTKPMPPHWSTDEGTEKANEYLELRRDQLGYGHLTDFELANAQYLCNRGSIELIGYQTAAKERIRWLSAQLADRDRVIEEFKRVLQPEDGQLLSSVSGETF